MNGHGWRGVHAFDAMAEGDGPLSFADFATQEFQWSKSVTNILLSLTPQFFGRLKAELKFQFLFAQFWYTFLGATMLFSFLIPPIALITKTPWVNVVYLEFFSYSSILMGTVIMMVFWLRKNGWQRPVNAKIFSWELMMFNLTRWPWVVLGVISSLKEKMTGATSGFKVTPKGNNADAKLPLRVLAPYAVIVIVSALPAILITDVGNAVGYYFFTIFNSLIYTLVMAVIVFRHIYESRTSASN